MKDYSQIISQYKIAHRMNTEQLAKKLDISAVQIYRWERREVCPSVKMQKRIDLLIQESDSALDRISLIQGAIKNLEAQVKKISTQVEELREWLTS